MATNDYGWKRVYDLVQDELSSPAFRSTTGGGAVSPTAVQPGTDLYSTLLGMVAPQVVGVGGNAMANSVGNVGYTPEERRNRNLGGQLGGLVGGLGGNIAGGAAAGAVGGPVGIGVGALAAALMGLLGTSVGKAAGSKKGTWLQALFGG